MKIYIDALLFLNLAFDFLLLLITSLVLRRNVKIFKILIGAFVGSFSIIVLFFNINSIELFLIKIYLSVLMVLIVFNYKNLNYTIVNLATFYLVSFLLGGFLYYLNIEFSYTHQGLIFYHKSFSINVIVLFIISPIILYIYLRQAQHLKRKIKNFYKLDVYIGNKKYYCNGYLDSGNNLSYKNKPVIISKHKFKTNKKKIIVPYNSIGNTGLLECIKVKIYVHSIGYFDCLMGYDERLNIKEDILLNNIMEGKHD